MDTDTPARRGRPRSEETRTKIFAATARLLIDQPYEQLTIAGIADLAGVGKQTVYRWWPSKASLVADCVLEDVVALDPVTPLPGGSAATAIHTWLEDSYRRLRQPRELALFRALTAAAASDQLARKKLGERFATPIRDRLTTVIDAGIATGELRATLSAPAVAEMLIGAMIYTIVASEPVDDRWADALLSTLALAKNAGTY